MTAYPRDLLAPLHQYVEDLKAKFDPYQVAFPLPIDAELTLLFDEAYHATFQTEEGRRPGFRILFASKAQLMAEGDLRLENRHWRLIIFDEQRPFTAAEITRIAPAAEFRRFLICVCNAINDKSPSLQIWALLDVGENWWQFVHHQRGGGSPPPDFLTVTSNAPGELSLSAGGQICLVLRNGAISCPSPTALLNGPLADHLLSTRNELYAEVTERLGETCWDKSGKDDDYPQRLYVIFLERILHRVRARAHGGSILFIPDGLTHADTRLTDRVTIKYPCLYDYAWDMLISSLVSGRQYGDVLNVHRYLTEQQESSVSLRKCFNVIRDKTSTEESLSDIAQAMSALTSVDGALVMTTRYRVFGFGAEVTCSSPSLQAVKVADSEDFIPISAFGTRHRAAFRFCSSFEEAIAFVVSQDGGVKAVKRVGADVVLWPDINAGAFGL